MCYNILRLFKIINFIFHELQINFAINATELFVWSIILLFKRQIIISLFKHFQNN